MAINRFNTFTPGDYTIKYIPTEFTPDYRSFEPMFEKTQQDKTQTENILNMMKARETIADNAAGASANLYQRYMGKKQDLVDTFGKSYEEGKRKLKELQQYIIAEKTAGEFAALESNAAKETEFLKRLEEAKQKGEWRAAELYEVEQNYERFKGTKYDPITGKYEQFNVQGTTNFEDVDKKLREINPNDFGITKYSKIIRMGDGKLAGVPAGYFGQEKIEYLTVAETRDYFERIAKSDPTITEQLRKEANYEFAKLSISLGGQTNALLYMTDYIVKGFDPVFKQNDGKEIHATSILSDFIDGRKVDENLVKKAVNTITGEPLEVLNVKSGRLLENAQRALHYAATQQVDTEMELQSNPVNIISKYTREKAIRPHINRVAYDASELDLHADHLWLEQWKRAHREQEPEKPLWTMGTVGGTQVIGNETVIEDARKENDNAYGYMRKLFDNAGLDNSDQTTWRAKQKAMSLYGQRLTPEEIFDQLGLSPTKPLSSIEKAEIVTSLYDYQNASNRFTVHYETNANAIKTVVQNSGVKYKALDKWIDTYLRNGGSYQKFIEEMNSAKSNNTTTVVYPFFDEVEGAIDAISRYIKKGVDNRETPEETAYKIAEDVYRKTGTVPNGSINQFEEYTRLFQPTGSPNDNPWITAKKQAETEIKENANLTFFVPAFNQAMSIGDILSKTSETLDLPSDTEIESNGITLDFVANQSSSNPRMLLTIPYVDAKGVRQASSLFIEDLPGQTIFQKNYTALGQSIINSPASSPELKANAYGMLGAIHWSNNTIPLLKAASRTSTVPIIDTEGNTIFQAHVGVSPKGDKKYQLQYVGDDIPGLKQGEYIHDFVGYTNGGVNTNIFQSPEQMFGALEYLAQNARK